MVGSLACLGVESIVSLAIPESSDISGLPGLALVADEGHVEGVEAVVEVLEPLDTPVIGSVGEEGLLAR